VCVFYLCVCSLHCINSDRFVLSNESHLMYQTSRYIRLVKINSNINVI